MIEPTCLAVKSRWFCSECSSATATHGWRRSSRIKGQPPTRFSVTTPTALQLADKEGLCRQYILECRSDLLDGASVTPALAAAPHDLHAALGPDAPRVDAAGLALVVEGG